MKKQIKILENRWRKFVYFKQDPLKREDVKLIFKSLSQIGFYLSEESKILLARYISFLEIWNNKVNLISRKLDYAGRARLIVSSILLREHLENVKGRILDLGTGAGIPGIPLKISAPFLDISLLEAKRKIFIFLKKVVELLNLNIPVFYGRVEELGFDVLGKFDVIIAREVGKFDKLIKWIAPILKSDGFIITYFSPKQNYDYLYEINATVNQIKLHLPSRFRDIQNYLKIILPKIDKSKM